MAAFQYGCGVQVGGVLFFAGEATHTGAAQTVHAAMQSHFPRNPRGPWLDRMEGRRISLSDTRTTSNTRKYTAKSKNPLRIHYELLQYLNRSKNQCVRDTFSPAFHGTQGCGTRQTGERAAAEVLESLGSLQP